jgi:hypothetical protein
MDPRIANLLPIVTRAPWWVWPVFLLLVVLGVSRLKARVISMLRLIVVPSAFLIWGLVSLGIRFGANPTLVLPWLGAAVLGSAIGWSTAPAGIRADRERRRVYVPGRAAPLIASLTVFVSKYAINVLAAVRPEAREILALLDMLASGMSAAYFWSGLVRTLLRYRQAPAIEWSAGPAPAHA